MAAANALNVVKQIQALAEGPATQEMRQCLRQVAQSLLFFLDHPDSRVRLGAARTLLRLSAIYPDEMSRLDLGRAKQVLIRCESKVAEGCIDTDVQELIPLLGELLRGQGSSATLVGDAIKAAVAAPAVAEDTESADAASPSDAGPPAADGRGEVVLKIGEETEAKVKARILEKVVAVNGVLSVAFEGPFIIVSTRTQSLASDALFLADILAGVKQVGIEGVSLVRTSSGTSAEALPPQAGRHNLAEAAEASDDVVAVHDEDDEDDLCSEPQYLDEQDDDEAFGGTGGSAFGGGSGFGSPGGGGFGGGASGAGDNAPLPPGGQYSFFAQSHWMTGRQMQEFGDDPTIAARLAKAKQRQEAKRDEERSKLSRLTSWFSGR